MAHTVLRRGGLLAAGASVFLLLPAAAGAQSAEAVRLRAAQAASAGRCEEALRVLDAAGPIAARDARSLVVRAQCEIRLGRHAEAVRSLEAARAADPTVPDLDLYTGMAQFHLGSYAAAERSLDAALARDPNRAEAHLYRGLVLLQRADSEEAATALERARGLGASAVEPVASYYAGLAWAGADERARARESLERVIRDAPGTEWASEAERRLEQLRRERPGRWFASLRAGFEYDTNVALEGSGVRQPGQISGARDWRAVWELEAGAEILRTPDWTVGALVRYYGDDHNDLERFNTHYPQFTLWADRRLADTWMLRGRYDFAYAWVDSNPYVLTNAWALSLHKSWWPGNETVLSASFRKHNFFFKNFDVFDGGDDEGDACQEPLSLVCGPNGIHERGDRNQDGQGIVLGLEHVLPLFERALELRGGYFFHRYSSRGTEWSHHAHELRVGGRAELPLGFVLDVTGSYAYRPYRNRSSFPDPEDVVRVSLLPRAVAPNRQELGRTYRLSGLDRTDDVWWIDVELERRITAWLTGSIRYTWIDNHSNRDVFRYKREIVGAYLTIRFHDLDLGG